MTKARSVDILGLTEKSWELPDTIAGVKPLHDWATAVSVKDEPLFSIFNAPIMRQVQLKPIGIIIIISFCSDCSAFMKFPLKIEQLIP